MICFNYNIIARVDTKDSSYFCFDVWICGILSMMFEV